MEFIKTEYKASDFSNKRNNNPRPAKYDKVQSRLAEFIASDAEVAIVSFDSCQYRDMHSVRTSVLKTAYTLGVTVRTAVRDGIMYVIKVQG